MAAKRRRRCKGKTKAGKRCSRAPLTDQDYCIAHAQRKEKDSRGFGGAQPGSGRPRKPTVTALLQERAAGRADVIDALYERGMTGLKLVAKYEGEVHVSDVDDVVGMIGIVERYLDRTEGKPSQSLNVHADIDASEAAQPVSIVAVDASDPEIRRLAHDLVKRLAGRPGTGGDRGSPSEPSRSSVARRRKGKAS